MDILLHPSLGHILVAFAIAALAGRLMGHASRISSFRKCSKCGRRVISRGTDAKVCDTCADNVVASTYRFDVTTHSCPCIMIV